MAHAKPVTKINREQKTSNFPEQYGYQPIGKEAENPEDLEGSNAAPAMKVKNRLPRGYEEFYIPDEQQAGNGNVSDQVKKKAKQAEGEVVRRRSPSRQPGYVTKSRVDTVGLTAHVPQELRTAVNIAAKQAGLTTQEFVVAVLTHAVAQQQPDQKPVKVDVAQALEKYREAQRNAVREAALSLAANLT
jgi:hypothetical protein